MLFILMALPTILKCITTIIQLLSYNLHHEQEISAAILFIHSQGEYNENSITHLDALLKLVGKFRSFYSFQLKWILNCY